MKYLSILVLMMTVSVCAHAKIWRINNTPGITADFTTFNAAATSASVNAGDTLHFEPSTLDYQTGSFTLSKRLVVIGPGYFLDPANTTTPANTGLQAATTDARITFFQIGSGANGSKFLGVTLNGSFYLNGVSKITFERDFISSGFYFASGSNDSVIVRKCFFNSGNALSQGGGVVITNFICENSIFYNGYYITLTGLSGSGNIFRNNSIVPSGNIFTLNNTYIANNIFGTGGQNTFTNCTIKNNLFQIAQTLPGTATGNQLSVNMANVFVAGTTGSLDARSALKPGSPAIAAGLTVGAVTTPDCGAFGATDPYKLSGIPNIPSIYTLTVPVSIPSGTTTMNITLSTRNNN